MLETHLNYLVIFYIILLIIIHLFCQCVTPLKQTMKLIL